MKLEFQAHDCDTLSYTPPMTISLSLIFWLNYHPPKMIYLNVLDTFYNEYKILAFNSSTFFYKRTVIHVTIFCLTLQSVGQLAHALHSERIANHQNTIVHIFWPKSRCHLLQNDVILLDSPGIDVEPNLDEWIDKHCMDADVFVLVSNAESTLMRTVRFQFYTVISKELVVLAKEYSVILTTTLNSINQKMQTKSLFLKI